MELSIGPFDYRVYMVPNLVDPATGEKLDGGISFKKQELYLDTSVIHRRRRTVLLHEYFHAWAYHLGRPDDEETQCDHFAAACLQFEKSLEPWGGKDALKCLEVKVDMEGSIPVLKIPRSDWGSQ
ncbi:MAG: hypothetical protein JKX85_06195 [Phycisphaeraceae bacterium]|nr:hypothetical protein [Phycisphaeraceae bacterium]